MCNQWKPIETAPKDGTEILVVDHHGEIQLVFWAKYWRHSYDWCIKGGEQEEGSDKTADNPTHWMPLPEPPDR
jgi:hypothetical protein